MYEKLVLYNQKITDKMFKKEYLKYIIILVLAILTIIAMNMFFEVGPIKAIVSMIAGFVVFICLLILLKIIKTDIYYDKDQKYLGSIEFDDDYCYIRKSVKRRFSKEVVIEKKYSLYYNDISGTHIYKDDKVISIFFNLKSNKSKIYNTNMKNYPMHNYLTIDISGPNAYIADYILNNQEIRMKMKAKVSLMSYIGRGTTQ